MSKGILFIMSGPSGTGKGTICDKLTKSEKLFLSISSTSREKRSGETEGVTYNYVTREEFEEKINNDEMLEYAEYSGSYYGTPRAAVEEKLDKGINVMLEIEPQGALKVKAKMPEAVMIFVLPPTMAELKRRLENRGRETAAQIEERLKTARWEIGQSGKYNFVVVNDNLEKCVEECRDIVNRKMYEAAAVKALLSQEI